jgi:hypothetical protein
MADKKRNSETDEPMTGASDERIRGVAEDDDSFEDDDLAEDEDDEEDEEGGSTF